MASTPLSVPSSLDRERLFFFAMSLGVAAMVVGGFGLRILFGVTDFHQPWWVHVHAVSFMGWIALYVLQNALVVAGKVEVHRRLGLFGAVFAGWIFFVGLALTVEMIAERRGPPFFDPSYFLMLNSLNVLFFGGLFYAAVALRRRPGWHRRLMLCSVLCVSIPGFARWVMLAGLDPGPFKHLAAVLLFLVPAALFDLATRGRVHSAYLWGAGALLALTLLIAPLSRLAVVVAATRAIEAHGTFF